MDEQKYQEYVNNGGLLSFEEFTATNNLLLSIDEPIKKKEQSNPNNLTNIGNPPLTEEIAMPISVDLDLNQIQQNVLNSSVSDITVPQPSTDLALETGASLSTENTNQNIPETLISQYEKELRGNGIDVNDRLEQWSKNFDSLSKEITTNNGQKARLSFDNEPIAISNIDKLAGVSNDIQPDITLTPTEERKYEEEKTDISEYVPKSYVNLESRAIAQPFGELGVSVTNNIEEDNRNILSLQEQGILSVEGYDNNGKAMYRITDKNYYDNVYVPYINKLNETLDKQGGEYNVSVAKNNANLPEIQWSESDLYERELNEKAGILITDEQRELLTTAEGRKQFERSLGISEPEISQEQKLALGNKYVNDIFFEGLKVSARNEEWEVGNITSNKNDGNYATDEKDEYNLYKNLFSNQKNIEDFGQFWNEVGKDLYDTSYIAMVGAKKNQRARMDVLTRFKLWQGRNDRLDYEMSEKNYSASEARYEKLIREGRLQEASQEEVKMSRLADLNSDAYERYNTRNEEIIALKNSFSKTKKEDAEREQFFIDLQNNDNSAGVKNFFGNAVLGIGTSIQNTIAGITRIIATPFGEGLLKDFADETSKPLQIGNVQISGVSDNVTKYLENGKEKYVRFNGSDTVYEIGANGKLFKPVYFKPSEEYLNKLESKNEYQINASGLAFVTAKMGADILLTTKLGGSIGSGAAKISNRVRQVFGAESAVSRNAASFARLAKDNVSVTGWYVQMYNDSYQTAEQGGIKSEAGRHFYAATQSFIQSLIQKINPDTNFLKTINTENRAIVSALMDNKLDKAKLLFESFAKKAINNAGKETIEENVQQLTQDFSNIIVNTLGNKDLQVSTVKDYKDTFVATVVPSIILSGMGGKTTNVNIGEKQIDLSKMNRSELVTELARTKGGLEKLQEFRDEASFASQVQNADELISEIQTIKKYIDKVPNTERHSTSTLTEVAPVLQEIESKRKELNSADETFKPRIQQEISELQQKANNILDGKTETAQPAPKSETTQGNTETNTENPTSETQSVPDAPNPIRPNGSGGAEVATESGVNKTFSDKTTGISSVDDLLDDDGYNYFYKGKGAEIVMMSPDEYLQKVREGQKSSKDENVTEDKKNAIKKAIEEGNEINMPFLDYSNNKFNQEGRNRAVVAKELGIQQMPVAIIKDVSYEDKINRATEIIRNETGSKSEILAKLKPKFHRDAIFFIDENFTEEDISDITNSNNGQTTNQEQSPTSQVEGTGQGSREAWQEPSEQVANQANEASNASVQSQEGEATQTEIDENDYEAVATAIDDVLSKLNNYISNEGKEGTDTSTNGTTESRAEIVQQGEAGQGGTQGISETTDGTGSETNAKIADNQYERNGKVYTRLDDGSFTVENSRGIQQKVTNKKTIDELNVLADARREESIVETQEKDGYVWKRYNDGTETIISPKGKVIEKTTERSIKRGLKTITVTNPQYTSAKARIFGAKTQSQLDAERRERLREVENVIGDHPTAEEAAMLFFANGGKVSEDSVGKQVLGQTKKEAEKAKDLGRKWLRKEAMAGYRWAYFGRGRIESIDETANSIANRYEHLDAHDVSEALINVIHSFSKPTEIQEHLIDLYNSKYDQDAELSAEDIAQRNYYYASDAERVLIDAQQAEDNLPDDEKIKYYIDRYENSIASLPLEEQEKIYRDGNQNQRDTRGVQSTVSEGDTAGDQGVQPQNEGVQEGEGTRTIQSEEVKNSPEYKQLIEHRTRLEARVKSAKEKLDRISKETNANFQSDQENLFGERPSAQNAGMFDERADGEAGRSIIAEAKAEYDNLRTELSRVNQRIKDFESGKTGGTGEIQFNIVPAKAVSQNSTEYQKAEKMFADGEPLEKIWKDTGFFLRKNTNDGSWEWAYRIDHGKIGLKLPDNLSSGFSKKLGDVIAYKEFFDNFKAAKDITLKIINSPSRIMEAGISKDGKVLAINLAYYDINTKSKAETKNLIAHELQHFLQLSLDNATLDYKITSNERANYRSILERKQESLNETFRNLDLPLKERREAGRRVANIQNALDYLDGKQDVSGEVKKATDAELSRLGYLGTLAERESRLAETDYTKSPYQSYNEDAENNNLSTLDFEADTAHLRTKAQQNRAESKRLAPMDRSAFDKLIEKLKKPFAKAFKNLNVTYDWNSFAEKAKSLGVSDVDIQRMETMLDYRMDHRAPNENDTPLHDLIDAYGEDIYGRNAVRYYGDGYSFDAQSIRVLQSVKGNPNAEITVYRAVPDLNFDINKKIKELKKMISYYNNYGFFDSSDKNYQKYNHDYYYDSGRYTGENFNKKFVEMADEINAEIQQLEQSRSKPLQINSGDWVSVSREYAKEHGISHLDGKYKIVSKKLKASQVFTDANSIHEQGVQFMHTANGDVYGAKLPDGTIYINPEKLNANTAIHEFSHLWEQMMPNAWKKGVELFKETKTGKELFAKLKAEGNYTNLTDDQLWSEAVNTHIGNIGDKRYANPRGKMKEFADWFKTTMAKFLNAVGIKNNWTAETKMSEFTDKVLGDLLGEKVLNVEKSTNVNGDAQFSIQPAASPKHKNTVPANTLTKVTDKLITEGEQSAMAELENSAWYKNASQSKKAEIANYGIVKFLLYESVKQKENADAKRKAAVEKDRAKSEKKIREIKERHKDSIEKIKDNYEKKIAEIKAKNVTLRQKQNDRRLLVLQTIRDLKSILVGNSIQGKITPNEISRLIKSASNIAASPNPTKSLNEFFQLYTSIQADSESRLKDKPMTRAQYEELQTFVEALAASGIPEADIIKQVKINEFSFSKTGVLTKETEKQVKNIIARYNTNQNADAEKLVDDAYNMAEEAQKKSFIQQVLDNPAKAFRDAAVRVIEDYSDRGFRVKEMLRLSGMTNVYNRFINAAGSSSEANRIHDKHFDEIFKGMSLEDRRNLDKFIVMRRIISIEKNRADRDLIPISHTNNITLEKAQEYINKIKAENPELYNMLNDKATKYFKAFNEQLDKLLESGIISQEAYDAMNGVEYQPRKFLKHIEDYQGVVDENATGNLYNTNSKSVPREPIKSLDEGDVSAQTMNADWLLRIAISANTKMTAMNEVNSALMTVEMPKARLKAEEIRNKPESDRTKEEKVTLRNFDMMAKAIKDNPITGVTYTGKPKYKYDSAPQGFTKNYYFVNGVRHEFFIADEYSDIWNDAYKKPLTEGVKNSKVMTTVFRKPTEWLKYMATGINPLFAITNTPRDFFQVLNFSTAYSKVIPVATAQLARDSVKAWKDISRQRKGYADTMTQKAMEYGIGMDFLYIQGQFEHQTRKDNAVSRWLDKLNVLSSYSELGTRIAIFSKMVDNGLKEYNKANNTNHKSVEEIKNEYEKENIYHSAVAKARGIMDFNQGGKKSKDLDTFIPYLNAAIQGTRSMVDALRKDPINTSHKILQTATMMTGSVVSLALMALSISDDDDEKSAIEKYLDFIERITPSQKMNYWNVPIPRAFAEKMNWALPEKKDNDEYYVLKLAKTQALTPFLTMFEEATNNILRMSVGRKAKDFGNIFSLTLDAVNKNTIPVELKSNPLEMVFSVANKIPVGKASVLSITGYDMYKGELLSSDIGKVIKGAEGKDNDNVEFFYKDLGEKYNLSPVRTKAVVESFITSPQTNPYVSLMYFGANSVSNFISGKEREYLTDRMLNDAKKLFSGRLVSQTSAYAVSLQKKKAISESGELLKIGMKDEIIDSNKKKWAKELANGRMSEDQIIEEIKKLDKTPNEKNNILKSVKERAENNDIDTPLLDIRYDMQYRSAEAKAQKLIEAYPGLDFTNPNEDANRILEQMQRLGGIATDDVQHYYRQMKSKRENR